jgi:hypothetical protein
MKIYDIDVYSDVVFNVKVEAHSGKEAIKLAQNHVESKLKMIHVEQSNPKVIWVDFVKRQIIPPQSVSTTGNHYYQTCKLLEFKKEGLKFS